MQCEISTYDPQSVLNTDDEKRAPNTRRHHERFSGVRFSLSIKMRLKTHIRRISFS